MERLKSVFTHVTKNIPAFIRDPAINLIGAHCYAELVENLNWNNDQCLKIALSKILGVGIVAGGAIVKIPQILKLLNSKSAAGLSISSYILETIAYGISLAYNVRQRFPISTYGETAFILVQNLCIMVLVFVYGRKLGLGGAILIAIGAMLYALFSRNVVSFSQLAYLQALTIPLGLVAKVPQIVQNYQNSSTGQLSAFTVMNYLIGSAARLFTTVTEVDDKMIFWSFALATVMNAILAIQMVWYIGRKRGVREQKFGQSEKLGKKIIKKRAA